MLVESECSGEEEREGAISLQEGQRRRPIVARHRLIKVKEVASMSSNSAQTGNES